MLKRFAGQFAFRSLSFRLTIWYAGVFLVIAVLLFGGLYFFLYSMIIKQTDDMLLEKYRNISAVFFSQGVHAAELQARIEAQAAGEKGTFVRLVDSRGLSLWSTATAEWSNLEFEETDIIQLLRDKTPVYKTVVLASNTYPIRVGFFTMGPSAVLEVGQSMENSYQLMELFRLVFILSLICAFSLTVVLSAILAGQLLKMIENVTETASEIAEGALPQLDRRVFVGNENDEIAQMARTFNTMLERVQAVVNGMEEMSDNMAHDLKSPVTRIRGLSEITLMNSDNLADYEKMTADIIDECDNLLSMINTILFISKAKHGVYTPQYTEINLNDVGEHAYQLFLPLAEVKDITFTWQSADRPLVILADRKLLQRTVANLIDNAIKYTNEGGHLDVSCMVDGDLAIMRICDDGCGIMPEDHERVFERFYRSEYSRTSEGAGLGLSFVKAAVEAMQGTVKLESELGKGSCFTLTFTIYHHYKKNSMIGVKPNYLQ